MNNKLQPALIAGGALAAISIVLSLVQTFTQTPGEQPSTAISSAISCLSCLLMLGAGMFAVYLYVQRSTTPATTGDGATLGALAGLIGGAINLVIGTPLAYFLNAAALDLAFEPIRQAGFDQSTLVLLFAFGIIGVVMSIVVALIGGLIGVPVFEKRKGDAGMPPPPPTFGGNPPMGGAPGGFGATPPPGNNPTGGYGS